MDIYAELNTHLVEAFGDLECLCNQIYDPPHGVTSYINIMESCRIEGNILYRNGTMTFLC